MLLVEVDNEEQTSRPGKTYDLMSRHVWKDPACALPVLTSVPFLLFSLTAIVQLMPNLRSDGSSNNTHVCKVDEKDESKYILSSTYAATQFPCGHIDA